MIPFTDRNIHSFLTAGHALGYPQRNVPLTAIAARLRWPSDATVEFAERGHNMLWDTDAEFGTAATILEGD